MGLIRYKHKRYDNSQRLGGKKTGWADKNKYRQNQKFLLFTLILPRQSDVIKVLVLWRVSYLVIEVVKRKQCQNKFRTNGSLALQLFLHHPLPKVKKSFTPYLGITSPKLADLSRKICSQENLWDFWVEHRPKWNIIN